jgi:hypothetical protein
MGGRGGPGLSGGPGLMSLGLGSRKPGTALGARSRAVQSHSFHNIIVP